MTNTITFRVLCLQKRPRSLQRGAPPYNHQHMTTYQPPPFIAVGEGHEDAVDAPTHGSC